MTGDAWTNVSAGQRFSPSGRVGASMAYDPLDNYLVLFGGCAALACPEPAQTWKFAGGNWSQVAVGSPQPPARSFASMAFDSKDGYVVLFGGWGAGDVPLNDTWAFVGGTWTNLTPPGPTPPPLGGGSMTFDPADGYLLLFGGGANTSTATAQTWRFSGGAWRNLTGFTGSTPTARTGGGLVWDDTDSYALLFGGTASTGQLLGTTWTFVHGRWAVANLTTGASPPPRVGPVLTYSGQDNAVLLFGGNGSAGPLGDTWRYSASRWANMTGAFVVSPGPRGYAAGLDSSVAWTTNGLKQRNGFLLVFGGGVPPCVPCGAGARNGTWVFEPILQATASALPSVVEVGQPTVLSATVTGGSPPYLLSWQFGDGSGAVSTSPSHAFTRIGTYNVSANAIDQAGVASHANATVSVVPGPTVGVSLSSTTTDVDRTLWLNASVSGGTPPYVVHWNLGDSMSATGGRVTHAFGLAGTYLGNVTATDGVGGSGVAVFSVSVHAALSFVASLPLTPIVSGENASFQVSISGGTPPYQVNWSFGDGTTSDLPIASHRYATGGSYVVRVEVGDAVGATGTENYSVDVRNGTGGATDWLGVPVLAWPFIVVVVAAAAISGVVLYRRRRRGRQRTDGPIAAIAAGGARWGADPVGDSRTDTRTARRSAQRGGRR